MYQLYPRVHQTSKLIFLQVLIIIMSLGGVLQFTNCRGFHFGPVFVCCSSADKIQVLVTAYFYFIIHAWISHPYLHFHLGLQIQLASDS